MVTSVPVPLKGTRWPRGWQEGALCHAACGCLKGSTAGSELARFPSSSLPLCLCTAAFGNEAGSLRKSLQVNPAASPGSRGERLL